jgi:hypothetical protein
MVLSSAERGGGHLANVSKLVDVARKVYALPAVSIEDMVDWKLQDKVLHQSEK